MDKNEIVSRLGEAFGGENGHPQIEKYSSYREDTGSLLCVSERDNKQQK